MMQSMTRALGILVVLVATATAGAASADRRISLDPRIAVAVAADNLMQPNDDGAPMVVAAAPNAHAGLWRAIDITMLIASTAALAIDWRQTRSAAMEHWTGRAEVGIAAMTLGGTPSPHGVDCYFATAAAVNVALWAALPPRWRSAIPGIVLGVEARTIAVNLPTTRF